MPKSSSAASPNWRPWRKDLAKGCTIVLVVLAMLCGLFAAGSVPAQAAEYDHSEAYSQLLDVDLLTAELTEAGSAHSALPSSPAPEYNQLDISALDALTLDLGGGLQLPLIDEEGEGLLQLGQLGTAHSYAHADHPTRATASAGTLTEDGAIAVDPSQETGDPARVDLTMLFNQLNVDGLTDAIIDEAGLTIGALASRAEANSGDNTRDYAIAHLSLDVASPLVGQLTTELGGVIDSVGGLLTIALGTEGILGGTLTLLEDLPLVTDASLDLEGEEDALERVKTEVLQGTITSETGLVSVDLDTGSIIVNLEHVMAGGLNGQAANTELIEAETLQRLTTELSQLLDDLAINILRSLEAHLKNIELTVQLRILGLGPTIQGSLADFLGETNTPPRVELVGLNLGWLLGSVTGILLDPIQELLSTVLEGLSEPLNDAVSAVVTPLSPVLNGVLEQLLQVTVNEQGTTELSGHEAHYVTALSLTLLPLAQAVNLDLATSTVRTLDDYADVVITSPEDGEVIWSDEVSVTGTAYPGVDVTVEVDGQTTTVTAEPSGAWSATFNDVSPGNRTVTATDEVTSDTVDFVVRVPVEITSPSEGAEVPGDEVPVTGTAAPNTEVTVTLCLVDEDCPTQASPSRTTQTDAEGIWSVVFSGVPSGEYTALAADEYDSDEVTFSVVYETTLQLDPDTLIPGSTTTVTGGGFAPGEEVVITLPDGDREGEIIPGDEVITTAGEDGNISVELEIPAEYPTGAVEIRAEGPISTTPATATLTVIAPVSITSPEDGEVFSGGTVPVTGTAEPGADVTVTLCAREGNCPEDSPSRIVSVDVDGNWNAEFTNIPAGSYTVAATDGLTQDTVDISVPAALQMPLTGGVGQGLYLAVGGLILLLALGLSVAYHRRKRAVHQS